jgi:hypothetical protein
VSSYVSCFAGKARAPVARLITARSGDLPLSRQLSAEAEERDAHPKF